MKDARQDLLSPPANQLSPRSPSSFSFSSSSSAAAGRDEPPEADVFMLSTVANLLVPLLLELEVMLSR